MKKTILDVVHQGVKDLHKSGLVDVVTMREFDLMCLPPINEYSPEQIKRIRESTRTSQGVFAAYLNVSPETVRGWEQGKKKPSGASLKLVNLVAEKGLTAVAGRRHSRSCC